MPVHNATLTTTTGTFSTGGIVYSYPTYTYAMTPTFVPSIRTVEIMAGHLGQICIDGQIVWESDPHDHASDAADEARERIQKRLRKTFA